MGTSTFVRGDRCPRHHPPAVREVINGEEKQFPTASKHQVSNGIMGEVGAANAVTLDHGETYSNKKI